LAQNPTFLIEPLGKHHHRAAFSCGKEALDSYLKMQAGTMRENELLFRWS
jgi:hypothetical protein